jgi:uncharacterized protein (TIGR02271 family)
MATHDTPTTGAAAGGASQLGRLNDLDEFKVADGYPDPRGWDVKTGDGRKLGTVDDLIVDTQAMRVRYVSVELDRSAGQLARDAATPGDQERHTLLPVGSVELDDQHDDVLVHGYTLEQVTGLPRYAGGAGRTIPRDYESRLVAGHRNRTAGGTATAAGAAVAGAAAAAGAAVKRGAEKVADAVTGDHPHHDYDHDDYNDQRLYARRRQGLTDDERRLVLAREELTVGKRQTSAGEVALRKTVDTERVQERVQLRHDEVSVERHPITDASAVGAGEVQITEDEIRVPIMEEQVVVEKKLVPREEIIVRKRAVVENQTVEADLRRERLDTSGLKGGTEGGPDAADRR